MNCEHMKFGATVNVTRLTSTEDGLVTGYMAEVRIHCVVCNKPFQFLGLEPGCDTQGARVTLDGLEANLALCPEGAQPNPFQRLQYGIKAFD